MVYCLNSLYCSYSMCYVSNVVYCSGIWYQRVLTPPCTIWRNDRLQKCASMPLIQAALCTWATCNQGIYRSVCMDTVCTVYVCTLGYIQFSMYGHCMYCSCTLEYIQFSTYVGHCMYCIHTLGYIQFSMYGHCMYCIH